jgi:hypothetical protein
MAIQENRTIPTVEQIKMRKKLGSWLRPVLRQETIFNKESGLERAREAARNGSGLVILWNHSAERDGFDAAKRMVVETPEFVEKPSVFPVAQHQEKWPLNWLEEKAAFIYPFITTSHTIERMREKMKKNQTEYYVLNKKGEMEKVIDDGLQYLHAGDDKEKYIELSREALLNGGSVSISFQGGRKSNLDVEKGPPTIAMFLDELNKDQKTRVDNFGFLLVGISGRGIKDFSKKSSQGLRPFRKTEIKIGPYYTLDELLNHPEVINDNPRVLRRNIDKFIRKQFMPLVPKAYLKQVE